MVESREIAEIADRIAYKSRQFNFSPSKNINNIFLIFHLGNKYNDGETKHTS